MDNTIFIFTTSYPFGEADTPYLTFELAYLERYFQKIILVPLSADVKRPKITNKYCVDTSLSTFPRRKTSLLVLLNKNLRMETIEALISGRFDRLKKLWWTLNIAQKVNCWVFEHVDNSSDNLLYSYWFSSATVGFALAKKNGLKCPCVTRTHRGDLYKAQTTTQFFPLRDFTLSQIDHVFTISQNGVDYLSKQYPKHSGKYSVAHLGVQGTGLLASPSKELKLISIVSCSYIRPVKRIELLCEMLASFGRMNPDISITWHHFGGGESCEIDKINAKLNSFPGNVQATIRGNVPNETIYEFYKTKSVDFFISVSSSEGIPVSMMEALSFGIPIISTDVGGVSELVNQDNGLLLNKDISADEGAKAITSFVASNAHLLKRRAAQETWVAKFNAEKNYSEFGSRLAELSQRK